MSETVIAALALRDATAAGDLEAPLCDAPHAGEGVGEGRRRAPTVGEARGRPAQVAARPPPSAVRVEGPRASPPVALQQDAKSRAHRTAVPEQVGRLVQIDLDASRENERVARVVASLGESLEAPAEKPLGLSLIEEF